MKKGIYNKTTKENININLKYADTYFKRLKGLMFKKNIDYGLVFIIKAKNRFSSGIHTSFMKFNIDVYFLDENLKIFDIQTLKPWEKYTPLKKADYIIEFEENKIKNNQKITRHEMLNLALAPFMSSKKPLNKQIEKTVKTLDEVRKSMKCSSDFVFGIELLIVEKFIKNERQHKKLTNILRDTMKIIDEWRQEDYENGKKEEKINTAKNMLKENYSIKQIAKITQLNIESIKQIKAEFGK